MQFTQTKNLRLHLFFLGIQAARQGGLTSSHPGAQFETRGETHFSLSIQTVAALQPTVWLCHHCGGTPGRLTEPRFWLFAFSAEATGFFYLTLSSSACISQLSDQLSDQFI